MPDRVATHTMQEWLSCKLEHVDLLSLMDRFHVDYLDSLKPLKACSLVARKNFDHMLSSRILNHCLPAAKRNCEDANTRVIKTIRLRMRQVVELMEVFPKMKVIHLVRDPRGMINSQVNTKLVGLGPQLQMTVSRYCQFIEDDLKFTRKLLQTDPGRIKLVKYEELASDPFHTVKELYKFAGLSLTDGVLNHVNKSTSSNLPDGCPYCTQRNNSTKTAYKWQDQIHGSILQLIDSKCANVYKQLGYKVFKPVRTSRVRTISNAVGMPKQRGAVELNGSASDISIPNIVQKNIPGRGGLVLPKKPTI